MYGIGLAEGDNINQILTSMAALSLKGSGMFHPSVRTVVPTQAVSASAEAERRTLNDIRAVIAALETEVSGPKEKTPPPNLTVPPIERKTEPGEEASTSEFRALRSRISALKENVEETLEKKTESPRAAQPTTEQSRRIDATRVISTSVKPWPTNTGDPRLKELESLYRQGKMGEEEYQRNKARLLKLIGT